MAAGIAVSCGSLVGLDVEESNRHTKADPLRLARRRLAPAEVASLEGELAWHCMYDLQLLDVQWVLDMKCIVGVHALCGGHFCTLSDSFKLVHVSIELQQASTDVDYSWRIVSNCIISCKAKDSGG